MSPSNTIEHPPPPSVTPDAVPPIDTRPPPHGDHGWLTSWLTLRNVWLWILPWGLFVRLCMSTIAPNDFWWHVRTGQWILQHRTIPVIDLFTYTQPGAPWINQAWLMQIALALLMQAQGAPLVIFAHALVITTGYVLVLQACAPVYGVRTSVWAAALGVAAGLQNWAVRPQAISFLAFGLLIFLIEKHRQGHRHALWWAIPLFAVWVNAHGVFVFGVALLGLYVVGTLWDALWRHELRARRRALLMLCAQGLLAVAVLALNPQGPLGIYDYVLGFFQSKATIQYNVEFAPLTVRAADGIVFTCTILFLFLARLNSTTRLTAAQTLTLLAFAAMTLMSRRSVPWFGMVQIPILASLLHGWWRQPWSLPPGKPLPNAAILVLLLIIATITLPWWRPSIPKLIESRPLLATTTPVDATAALCAEFSPGTHGYQALGYASYMEYACPDLPTFLDTRFELFTTAQWDAYIDMQAGRYRWAQIAADYDMRYIFANVASQPDLVAAVEANADWYEVYRDDQAVIFARR